MVYFWYPTVKSVDAKGQYIPGAAQMDAAPAIHEFMSQEFGNLWAPIVSGEISSHAIDRAPIASSRTPFPVVTFSQGPEGSPIHPFDGARPGCYPKQACLEFSLSSPP
jgi:hypothetical protein